MFFMTTTKHKNSYSASLAKLWIGEKKMQQFVIRNNGRLGIVL